MDCFGLVRRGSRQSSFRAKTIPIADGSIALAVGSRALALVRGRAFVTPEDVKELAPSVLRHRLVLTYEAEAEGVTSAEVIDRMLLAVEVP